jgi:hypothetical protein
VKDSCFLIIDYTTLDKPYSHQNGVSNLPLNGKHQKVVKGINVVTLHWTDGTSIIPLDFKVYDHDHDGKTKNDHFQDMLKKAKEHGFEPHCVPFES